MYLYLGLNDFYLPSAAAAMHLELVPVPDYGKLREIKHFRPFCRCDEGMFLRMGTDKRGNEVYLAAVSAHPEIFVRGLNSLLAACGIPPAEVKIILCQPENPQIGRIVSLLNRMGLRAAADRLGAAMVRIRLSDLKRLIFYEKRTLHECRFCRGCAFRLKYR